MADDAGALLVRSGLITADALELARALVQSEGGSLGEHLVATSALGDDALTEFYRTRLLVPQVNPNTLARLPESVVASIPADLAIDLRVIPVALGEGITIAMGDPSSRLAVDEVSSITGTYVIRSVATQMQIAWCLAHYYGHVTTLGQRLVQGGQAGDAATPLPMPVAAPPRRARGLTSKVNAARHRALPPITSQVSIQRPDPALLDDPSPVIEIQADDAADDEVAPPPVQGVIGGETGASEPLPAGRVRTLTGEIKVRAARAQVSPVDELDSEPTIEVSAALMPKRRAANWQDPPELASRAGEVQSRVGTLRAHTEEPAVVIADEAFDEAAEAKARANRLAQLNASVEVKVEEDTAIVTSQPARGMVEQPLDESDSAPILLQARRPTLEQPALTAAAAVVAAVKGASAAKGAATAAGTAAAAAVARGAAAAAGASAAKGAAVPQSVEGDEASGVVLLAQPKLSGSRPAVTPPPVTPPGKVVAPGTSAPSVPPRVSGATPSSAPPSVPPRVSGATPSSAPPSVPPRVSGATPSSASSAPSVAGPTLPSAPVLPGPTLPSKAGAQPAAAGAQRQRRVEKRTQLGLGVEASKAEQAAASPSGQSAGQPAGPSAGSILGRAARDTEVTIIPAGMEDDDEVTVEVYAYDDERTTPSAPAMVELPAEKPPSIARAGAPASAPLPSVVKPQPSAASPSVVKPQPSAASPSVVKPQPSPSSPSSAARPQPSAASPSPAARPQPPPAAAGASKPSAPPSPSPLEGRPAQRAAARPIERSEVDDGWGPPGSTIPPPWLGAIPGGIDADGIPSSAIPISDESGPLLIAPPSPPQSSGRRNSAGIAAASTEDLVAELEVATGRVVELVRRLDQASDRDQIIDLLVNHLADSHHRAGFLTVRQGVLSAFRIVPAPAALSAATLKLDGPSTLQDVVDTQLPYRGPLADELSRQFLSEVLGEVPAEILLVPITVRERAVGVLFAERRKRHTFDEQLAVASRAAGVAFERVVRARRER